MGILGGVNYRRDRCVRIVLRNLAGSFLDDSIRELVGIPRTCFA
jgi:hypothetical protein